MHDEMMTAATALAQIRAGVEDLGGQPISGTLVLDKDIEFLPRGIVATAIEAKNCTKLRYLTNDLHAGRLDLSGCTGLTSIPEGLHCFELDLRNTNLEHLPLVHVQNRLNLSNNIQLKSLPRNLKVGSLVLRGCSALESLPEGIDVNFLDLTDCVNFRRWPSAGRISVGRIVARNCINMPNLPAWLGELAQLSVRGCSSLTELPASLVVHSWLDLGNTEITSLPEDSQVSQLRWNGVPIDERIAFQPETISVSEIIDEVNVERRRVLLERKGYEEFFAQAEAKELDRDRDTGGVRRLLQMPMPNDEDLVCLAVQCPSTDRRYVLRVPPSMRSCHQAAAWIAGFDNPDDYKLLKET
ncbi:DUF6745 domain-containing protein [Herpetosiphon giganteus]|uniref:DUF6745 domain-containing protein n=1 Tax=Herpetosiphon giganteus TaxID=2029754 RepID=UPI0019570334|nr:hypothetical protein [Herpetosiphon giganteus]MBM7844552.1 hypothetical protein [Herpetosiphon giganteus]